MEQGPFSFSAFPHAFNSHIWVISVCVAAANVLLLQPLQRADKEDRLMQVPYRTALCSKALDRLPQVH